MIRNYVATENGLGWRFSARLCLLTSGKFSTTRPSTCSENTWNTILRNLSVYHDFWGHTSKSEPVAIYFLSRFGGLTDMNSMHFIRKSTSLNIFIKTLTNYCMNRRSSAVFQSELQSQSCNFNRQSFKLLFKSLP